MVCCQPDHLLGIGKHLIEFPKQHFCFAAHDFHLQVGESLGHGVGDGAGHDNSGVGPRTKQFLHHLVFDAEMNKLDRRSDLLGIVKAASTAVIAIVILVIFIVGVTKYMEAKEIDSRISKSELALFESLERYQLTQNEQTNAMILLTNKLKDVVGSDNLRAKLNEAGSG